MLFRTRRGTKGWRAGIAATELAVLLPFLMFMWVVAVDWARIFYYSVTIQYAARDGCYYASDYPGIYGYSSVSEATAAEASNLDTNLTVITGYSTTGADPTTATFASYDLNTNSGKPPAGATFVKIEVRYTFTTITNFPGVPSTTVLTRSEIMRVAPITPG